MRFNDLYFGAAPSYDQWHTAVLTVEDRPAGGSFVTVYVDGRTRGTQISEQRIELSGAVRYFATYNTEKRGRTVASSAGNASFDGKVGPFAFYQGVLSPEEVVTLNQNYGQNLSFCGSATGNRAPQAQLEGLNNFLLNEAVRFDAGKSFDPDGDVLAYTWAVAEVGTGQPATTYTTASPYLSYTATDPNAWSLRVYVTVTDPSGAEGTQRWDSDLQEKPFQIFPGTATIWLGYPRPGSAVTSEKTIGFTVSGPVSGTVSWGFHSYINDNYTSYGADKVEVIDARTIRAYFSGPSDPTGNLYVIASDGVHADTALIQVQGCGGAGCSF